MMYLRPPRILKEPSVTRSTYEPIFIYGYFEGPLPYQGKYLGSIRVNPKCPWFARFSKE